MNLQPNAAVTLVLCRLVEYMYCGVRVPIKLNVIYTVERVPLIIILVRGLLIAWFVKPPIHQKVRTRSTESCIAGVSA